MKLGSVKVKETTTIEELFYPDGSTIVDEKTVVKDKKGEVTYAGDPVTITIASAESDKHKEALAEQSRTNAQRSKNQPKRAKNSGFTKSELDRAEDSGIELLAAVTVAWTGIDDEDGSPLECNKENAFRLYKELSFLRRQVQETMGDNSAFFEK